MSVYRPDHHFQEQCLGVEICYLIFLHPVVDVMEIGVLYLSYAMLALAELIVCSTRGFACILAK